MMLSQDEQTALQFFADGPTQVSALFTTFSRTRSYKLVRRLCSKGALRKVGANRELTPGGRALLTPVTPADTWITAAPGLEAAIPHLRHAPTPHHKAFLSLGLCARVARLHRLRESHHPALLAAGPTARFKTWGGKALILMCGGDPSADVVYLGIESGRSLVSRKKSDGTRATLRAALTRPAVVLDEWLRAKLDVRKLVELYLFGELAVADEDGQLEVLAVPVVTLNPRDGKSLEQQLGLDEAMLRRAIVFVLDDVAIPDELLASGDDLLEAIRDLGPVETPAPRFPELDARGDVQRILTDALDDRSRLARIDITMLSMLVTAATAWLDPQDALHTVMEDYLLLLSLLGWTRLDWRRALPERATAPAAAVSAKVPPAATAATEDLDYERRLHALAAGLEARGVDPEQGLQLLDRLRRLERAQFRIEDAEALHAAFTADGSKPKVMVEYLARQARRHRNLSASYVIIEKQFEELQQQVAAAKQRLAEVHQELRDLDWTEDRVRELHRLDRTLRRLDLQPADLDDMAAGVKAVAAAADTPGVCALAYLPGLLAAIRLEAEAEPGFDTVEQACSLVARLAVKGVRLQQALANVEGAAPSPGRHR